MNTDKNKLLMGIVLAATLSASQAAPEQEYDWDKAEKEIRRLKLSEFKSLPQAVVKELEEMGCTIPQSYLDAEPHNAVRGEFARKGQVDWAVLCSKEGTSSIVVFWGKHSACARAFATSADRRFLQGLGEGRIGYSRVISPVDRKYINDHYKSYGGQKPPVIQHQGIDDGFAGKASVVHYCHKGKWLVLAGAD
ncbi:MAG: hypothetical protein ACRD5I_00275 [Candidatus Acidiferrales bacterium]